MQGSDLAVPTITKEGLQPRCITCYVETSISTLDFRASRVFQELTSIKLLIVAHRFSICFQTFNSERDDFVASISTIGKGVLKVDNEADPNEIACGLVTFNEQPFE